MEFKKFLVVFTISLFGVNSSIVGSVVMEKQVDKKRFQLDEGTYYCNPSLPCWPTQDEWGYLNKKVKGNLIQSKLPQESCKSSSYKDACKMHNPFFLESIPGGTQITGMLNAWDATISPYAVAAENAQDVAAAVNFARKHKLKVAIKGTGHDYFGRSNAPDSLLIWTHKMRDIKIDDKFVCQGCNQNEAVPAVTFGAGTRWLELYNVVATEHKRYVQGGGCTSVGAAGGFPQGGGYGSYSKRFGTGAANIVEIEVITADGKIRIANKHNNSDLFWSLRGGGGGTFGVVSKMTMKTHDTPTESYLISGDIKIEDAEKFKELIEQFIHFFREKLNNEHFGEKVTFKKDSLAFRIVSINLTKRQVDSVWKPFLEWARKEKFEVDVNISFLGKGMDLWNRNALVKVKKDFLEEDNKGHFWWKGDLEDISYFYGTYQGKYVPSSLISKEIAKNTAQTFYDAVQHHSFSIHIGKGLSGAHPYARRTHRETSLHPAVLDTVGLFVAGASIKDLNRTIKDDTQTLTTLRNNVDLINKTMNILTKAIPHAGSYANEADYFQKNWQQEFWGDNYPKLLRIKKKYDPNNVFSCHHCVGSEFLEK